MVADAGNDRVVSSQPAPRFSFGNYTTHLGSLSMARGFLPDLSQAGFSPPLPFQSSHLALGPTWVVPPSVGTCTEVD